MKSVKLYAVLSALLILMMILSACGATDTPAPAPTAAVAEPTAEPTAVPPTEEPAAEVPDAGALAANPWQWTSFAGPEEQFDVEMPESYLLAFHADALGASGTLNIVADCNTAMGSYTEDAGSLSVEITGMTRAMCPPESRSDQYVGYLGAAARYFFEDGMLYIDLFADGGTMAFAPADPELMADDGEGALAGEPSTIFTDEQVEMLAAVAPPPQLSERELGIHTVPCLPGSVQPEAGDVEGEDYYCGVFTVPQNWDEPDGRNLDLAFLVVKARSENPQPDPLVILTGGPGASAILSTHISKYEDVLQERDLVLSDIRGVGLSQRIGYEECLVLALQNGAPADQIETLLEAVDSVLLRDLGIEPPEADVAWRNPKNPMFNQICGEQFTAQGLDLNHFSTADLARDTAEIVAALGYDSFNIDSVSYGTRLAMTVMNDLPTYPDAPELRSAILDSTFPPSVYLIRTRVRSEHDHLVQLLDECQADAACNTAYPDLGNRLSRLFASLEEEPLTVGDETVTVESLAAQLNLIALTTKAAYIPRMIAELETGVLDTYLALRDGIVGTNDAEEPPPQPVDPNDPVVIFVTKGKKLLDNEQQFEFEAVYTTSFTSDDPMGTFPQVLAFYFSDELLQQLTELWQTITPEDIAASAFVAQLPRMEEDEDFGKPLEEKIPESRIRIAGQFVWFEYAVIHCIDDILHERFEDVVNSYNDLEFPQIALSELENASFDEMRCENLPVTAASLEVKNPVSSTVRTLVLQGGYDEQTPVYMGKRADRELENSVFVLVPQAGHGTWRTSEGCASDIAYAFLMDPEAELDLSCLEARKPQWSLPGDSLLP